MGASAKHQALRETSRNLRRPIMARAYPVLFQSADPRRSVAQYMLRAPLSLEKMSYDPESCTVIYRSRMHEALKRNFQVMYGADWMAQLCSHIPDGTSRSLHYAAPIRQRMLHDAVRHGLPVSQREDVFNRDRAPRPRDCGRGPSARGGMTSAAARHSSRSGEHVVRRVGDHRQLPAGHAAAGRLLQVSRAHVPAAMAARGAMPAQASLPHTGQASTPFGENTWRPRGTPCVCAQAYEPVASTVARGG